MFKKHYVAHLAGEVTQPFASEPVDVFHETVRAYVCN